MVITKAVLKRRAHGYFDAVLEHLRSLKAIGQTTRRHSEARQAIEDFMHISGLSAADVAEDFDQALLENEEFTVSLLLFVCVSMMTNNDQLTYPEFHHYMAEFQRLMGRDYGTSNSLRFFSEKMKIDSGIVPDYVHKNLANRAEEDEANKICMEYFEKFCDPENYHDYETYLGYMEGRANDLINKLTFNGYTNSFDAGTMAKLFILKKVGFPVPFLYNVEKVLPIPIGIIDALAQKLFKIGKEGGHISGIDGGLIDLGGGDD